MHETENGFSGKPRKLKEQFGQRQFDRRLIAAILLFWETKDMLMQCYMSTIPRNKNNSNRIKNMEDIEIQKSMVEHEFSGKAMNTPDNQMSGRVDHCYDGQF